MSNKPEKGSKQFGFYTFINSFISIIFVNLSNIFLTRASIRQSIARSLRYFLWTSCSRSGYGARRIEEEFHQMKSGKQKALPVEGIPDDEYVCFWVPLNKFIYVPLFVSENRQDDTLNLSFIKGTLNLDSLLVSVTNDYYNKIDYFQKKCQKSSRRFRVVYHMSSKMRRMKEVTEEPNPVSLQMSKSSGYEHTYFESEGFFVKNLIWDVNDIDFSPRKTKNPFEFFYVTKEAEYLINQIGAWAANKEFYEAHHKPHKKNFLIYGPPGTGKTATIRASAQFFDYPIHIFDLGSLNNEEFARYWTEMVRNAPCFAVFEDLDKIFKGDQNVITESSDESVTFNFFLQCLEGMEQVNGVVTFITTNDPESFDKRLAYFNKETGEFECRHGRVDEAINFDYLCDEGKLFLANKLLKKPELIESVMKDPVVNRPITATNFVGICFRKLVSPKDFDLLSEMKSRYNVDKIN